MLFYLVFNERKERVIENYRMKENDNENEVKKLKKNEIIKISLKRYNNSFKLFSFLFKDCHNGYHSST